MRFSHTKRGNAYYFFKVLTADVRQMVIRESCGIKYNPVIEAFVWNSKIKKEGWGPVKFALGPAVFYSTALVLLPILLNRRQLINAKTHYGNVKHSKESKFTYIQFLDINPTFFVSLMIFSLILLWTLPGNLPGH